MLFFSVADAQLLHSGSGGWVESDFGAGRFDLFQTPHGGIFYNDSQRLVPVKSGFGELGWNRYQHALGCQFRTSRQLFYSSNFSAGQAGIEITFIQQSGLLFIFAGGGAGPIVPASTSPVTAVGAGC